MNSVAPDTKRAAAKAVEEAGGRYVDVAVMAPVDPKALGVPLLLAGAAAPKARRQLLNALGFSNTRIVGERSRPRQRDQDDPLGDGQGHRGAHL